MTDPDFDFGDLADLVAKVKVKNLRAEKPWKPSKKAETIRKAPVKKIVGTVATYHSLHCLCGGTSTFHTGYLLKTPRGSGYEYVTPTAGFRLSELPEIVETRRTTQTVYGCSACDKQAKEYASTPRNDIPEEKEAEAKGDLK